MIAGLEEISEGELYIGDKLVNDIEPKDRDIAMVFKTMLYIPTYLFTKTWHLHLNLENCLKMK